LLRPTDEESNVQWLAEEAVISTLEGNTTIFLLPIPHPLTAPRNRSETLSLGLRGNSGSVEE